MLKVVKFRLYPNAQQKQSLEQSFGNCRWLWNFGLSLMNQTYKETGKGLSSYEVKKLIPKLKQEHQWLKLTYSQCLQQVCINLGTAFNIRNEGLRILTCGTRDKAYRQTVKGQQ